MAVQDSDSHTTDGVNESGGLAGFEYSGKKDETPFETFLRYTDEKHKSATRLSTILQDRLTKGVDILDVGAGNGEYLHLALAKIESPKDITLTLVEPSDNYVNQLNTRFSDIPAIKGYDHTLFSGFDTNAFPEALYGREKNNISLKRNMALLLGYMVGWRKLLFLDDDITIFSGLDDALVAGGVAVGFLVTDFPDNSVVRHAERLSGVEPGISLSGGALLVDATRSSSFFPNIYNEDWFYLYDVTQRFAPPNKIGAAVQLPYDPFSSPVRAASEEFGDVLAEGIMQLYKSGVGCKSANEIDWREMLDHRKALIGRTRTRLAARGCEHNVKLAVEALLAAEAQLDTIRPVTCVDYIAAWQEDTEKWRRRLAEMPKELSVDQALEVLGL